MGYHPKIYADVRQTFEDRAKKAETDAEARAVALYPRLPGLREIDRALSDVGPQIFAARKLTGAALSARIEEIRKETDSLHQKRRELLLAAGYPEDYLDVRYACPYCHDTGFVARDGDPFSEQLCVCFKKALYRASVDATGVGRLISTQTFENFNPAYYKDSARAEQNLSRCRAFAENPTGNLLLLGGTGLGKTHLSIAIAGVAITLPRYVVFETVGRLVEVYENIKFGRKKGAEEEDSPEKYLSCDLLILDDLGSEMTTSFTVSVLYALLTQRINRRLPMVVSTNLSPGELAGRYTDRIASRLLGEFDPVYFEGDDIRLMKKNGNA